MHEQIKQKENNIVKEREVWGESSKRSQSYKKTKLVLNSCKVSLKVN